MKKTFAIIAASAALFFAAPALAQSASNAEARSDAGSTSAQTGVELIQSPPEAAHGWSYFAVARAHTEGQYADIFVTRAQDTPVIESVFGARYDNGNGGFIAVDRWNMEAFDPGDRATRCAVHETDYELEVGQADFVGSVDGRAKFALYEVCGEDITSLRLAVDYPLGGDFSATSSVEFMTGGAEVIVTKPIVLMYNRSQDGWHVYGEVAPTHNTLERRGLDGERRNEWGLTYTGRITYGTGRFTAGGFVRGYASDDDDIAGGIQLRYAR